MIQKLSHGEIWLANLTPNKGSEPGKVRPVLILQDQVLLDSNHPTTIIIPLTTQLVNQAYPLRIRIKANGKLEQDSDLLIDQICAIDNQRLVKGPLMQCSLNLLNEIYQAINEVLGLSAMF